MTLPIAEREIQYRDRLRIEQTQWTPLWRNCAAFCCPHKQRTVENFYAELTQQTRPWFNPFRQSSTAIDALNVLSGGCKSWLVPGGVEGMGAQWQPDPSVEDSAEVKDWLAECTRRAQAPLQRGGFFTATHEMFQDLGVFGTEGFLIEEGDDDAPIYCQAIMPTNFVLERDWKDEVMRVIITYSKPASLIRDQFQEEGDKVPDQVTKDCEGNNGQQPHEFIRSIYRRSEKEQEEYRENEPEGQEYGSCWIHVASKTIMRERGYTEMPFMAPRWNTWAGTGPSNYGTSPAMQAIADMKGLNLFDMVMATRAELEINPRVKVMPSQTGAIDLSPGGITQMSDRDGVTEWAMPGTYAIGKDQTDVIEGRINRAFFKDLFEAISPIARERDVTNYVAQAVQQEAAARITPAMGRVEQDFFQPALDRIFMVLLRAGVFPDPPPQAFHTDSSGHSYLIRPKAVQANRMSRTLNAKDSYAFGTAMGRALQIAQVDPSIFDYYKFDRITQDLDRGDGLPGEWRYTMEEVQKTRALKAQAAQEQQATAAALQAFSSKPQEVAQLATGQIGNQTSV